MSGLSNAPDIREWNKNNIQGYFEVYLKSNQQTLYNRDPKGIYKKYLNGEINHVVGEDIKLNIVCPDDEVTEVEVSVNVEDVKIQKSDKHDPVIQLTDQVAIVMKYPSMEMFVKNNITGENQQKVDTIFDMTIDCISQVVEGEDVLEAKSFSKKEMLEFVETFDTQQFQKIQDFFETMPKLSHTIKVLNPKTNIKSEVVIEGLSSFFD